MGWYDQVKEDHLEHHGVLGQKWGIRRFQNRDGSLTAEGKKRVYAGGAEGGYESFRHRTRRAIDSAKYDHDIEKTEAKLDKALSKGNQKKADKYSDVLTKLKINRDIMVKDLSPEEIKYGHDYLKTMNAVVVGNIIAGPIGGAAAGLAVSAMRGGNKTAKEIQEQDRQRKIDTRQSEVTSDMNKANETADRYHKQGVYTYEYTTSDGKRHVEPIKDEKTAMAVLKDYAYEEQTKAIKAAAKEKK